MKHDFSFGIIPARIWRKQWQVLLVHHHAGHWAFPKGHPEPGESPQQTAERELFEETGLKVEAYLSNQTLLEHYFFQHQHQLIEKKVEYFVALVSGNVIIQVEEIQDSKWLPLDQAQKILTFKASKSLCLQAQEILENL